MAEYDPAGQEASWNEGEGYGGAEDNQQGNTEHSTHQDQAEYSVSIAPNASGDGPSSQGGPADDVGDYDPASVQPVLESAPQDTESPAPLKPSPQPVAKKPRTAGGFLVGDSDSEDDSDEPAAVPSGHAPGSVAQSSVSHSFLQNNTAAPDGMPSNASPPPQANVAVTAPANSSRNGLVASPSAASATANSAAQAPPDNVAFLEARVRDDPRGALDQWLALIAEYRTRNDLTLIRQVYERFLVVFPQAADIWADYLDLELSMNNFPEAETIFSKCLLGTPNVALWTKYLDYIRRRNDLSDSTGMARQTVAQAYEFVIDNIGLDKDSGKIWADYIQFIKFGPGTVGGSQWQDQQKMDQLRRTYQRAICVPISNVNVLWKEYDQFEMGLNKVTGRKYLADKSPSYMSAKSANTALENITRGLNRTTLPRLPPAPGFDGDQEYAEQVEIWKKWIRWEKTDPLDIREDKEQPELYNKRILHVYNQALMALRFWPEMWVDAAQWCLEENITTVDNNKVAKDGKAHCLDYLTKGIEANPESILLALRHADYIESTYPIEETDDAKHERGEAVKAPYNKVLDTLYAMIKRLKDRETAEITRIEETYAADGGAQRSIEDDDEDEDSRPPPQQDDSRKQGQIRALQQAYNAQTQLLSRAISFVWIALIRAMRRIQGKGKPNTKLGGMRQAFTDARQRGRLTSDVYAAVAQLEWTIYKDPAGGRIFDRGAKLFPEDENFTLENIKYLHSRDDFTNARVLFETVVNRLTQKPESVHKAKVLYAYLHKYESQFGELSQIAKLEKRMAELFPEDPKLALFSARYSTDKFDPIAARIIVSPATQLRPKQMLMPSIEQPMPIQDSPRPLPFARNSPHPQFLDSPKRPLAGDDTEEPPRKIQRNDFQEFQRGVSPLKGAAGRRLDQQRRMQGQGATSYTAVPAPIARDITFLMSVIPRAETYDFHRLNPGKMVNLVRDTVVPDFSTWKSHKDSGVALRGGHGPAHNRQISSDFAGHYNRDSPAPPGRPLSPYTGERGRLVSGSGTYRQSSLRPGSSGSYEPPPASFSQPPPQYGQPPVPVLSGQFDPSAWQQPAYGAPPPQQGYGAPPPQNLVYGQGPPPPPQQQGYSQFRY